MKSRRFMKSLTSPIHFHTAMLDESPVCVFNGQEMVGSGKIEKVTDFSVKIGNEYHVISECDFKYAN